MIIPGWLIKIGHGARDEKTRAAHGLTAKRDGWYKSIDGKTRYICKPCGVGAAVESLQSKLGALDEAGRVPIVAGHNLTMEQLVETFLAQMLERLQGAGKKLDRQTYDDYVRNLSDFVEVVGANRIAGAIGPADFSAFMKTIAGAAASTRRRKIQNIDRLFNWAGPGKKSLNWIGFAIRGPDWIKPSDEDISTSAADSDKAYSVAEVVAAFGAVKNNPLLNAAAHLGLNCAFSPMDVGTVPEAFIDLEGAEIRFARGKTGVGRLCTLLPETVGAVKSYLTFRSRFKSVKPGAEGLLFRTREGMPYARWFGKEIAEAGYRDNLLSRQWGKVVGLPFSGLRSTFATLADDWHDQRAIDVIMGHKVGKVGRHIRRHYAKKFSPERVRPLVERVWLLAFGKEAPSQQPPSAP